MISRAEAAGALRDIEASEARALEARGYSHASPQLILWGVVWIAGYTLCGLTPPEQWGWVWLPVDIAGILGSLIIGSRMSARNLRGGTGSAPQTWRFFWPTMFVMLSSAAFLGAVFYVFAPAAPEPYLVFPAILVGLLYVVLGAWRMRRMAWIGAAIFVLAMLGFVFLKPILAFWIAGVGGGGLVLGGLWLRKA